MVIGSLRDTAPFIGQEGFNVLNTKQWTPAVNDAWVARGIHDNRIFQLATPVKLSVLRAGRILPDGTWERTLTVYYRELKMLRDARYVQQDGFMIPAEQLVPAR